MEIVMSHWEAFPVSTVIKFLIFQCAIIIPPIAGYFTRRSIKNAENTAKKTIRINLFFIEPLIVLWTIWGLTLSFDQIFLPLAGLMLVLAGFFIGKVTVHFTGLKNESRKTYLISSSLANHGFTMGGLICYLVAGEQGLGLASLFTLYFVPYTFIFIFSYARTNTIRYFFSLSGFMENFINLQNIPLYAAILALLFHLLDIQRPNFDINLDPLLFVSIALYYFTLGLNFDFGDFRSTGKEQFLLSFSKFLVLPLIAYWVLDGTDLKEEVKSVILIESFMPAAVYSVVTSILFKLDTKLASSLFFINTLIFLSLVLPAILYFSRN